MQPANIFMNKMAKVFELLQPYEDILSPQDNQNLKTLARNLNNALCEEADKGRLLKIGIVGSVKAGKSTFLNALLFRGESILPKAATPMTASLTRMVFSREPFARFVFYTQADWTIIEENHRRIAGSIEAEYKKRLAAQEKLERTNPEYIAPQIDKKNIFNELAAPVEQKACYELVESAKAARLNLGALLGSAREEKLRDARDAARILEDYVGRDGKYSAVVKYVELGIDNELLEDLEIIDTPGLNDPIVSRTQITYAFLNHCDAVFLLSRASQFFTGEDKHLLEKTLLDNGISRVVLLATQMDMAAQDEVGNTPSYQAAFQKSARTVFNTARKNGSPQPPIPVCAMFETWAYKKERGLPPDTEEAQLERNLLRFSEEAPRTPGEFREYGNMAAVTKELTKCRAEKDEIIRKHQEDRAREARRSILETLDALVKGADTDKRILQENDISSLQKLYGNLRQVIDHIEQPISAIFISMEKEIGVKLAELNQRILANSNNFTDIEVASVTRPEREHYSTGFLWWKKEHVDIYNVTDYTVKLADAMQQLRAYAARCEEDINDTIKEMLDPKEIDARLKKVVLPVYHKFEEKNLGLAMNEDMITAPINAIVQRITIPELKFDTTPYNNALIAEFGESAIKNDAISNFTTKFDMQIQNLCTDIRGALDDKKNELKDLLAKNSVNFAGVLRENLSGQIKKLEEQMRNREKSLDAYNRAREVLARCKKLLVE